MYIRVVLSCALGWYCDVIRVVEVTSSSQITAHDKASR